MKKPLIIFLFVFGNLILRSQVVFCSPGAEWHYSFVNYFPYSRFPEVIQYAGDSVAGNETIKILHHRHFWKCQNLPNTAARRTLIKQRGDTIFMNSLITQSNWQILYNFNVSAGQSWQNTISVFSSSPTTLAVTYTVSVDSVKTITYNGFDLKRLFVKYWSQYASSPLGYELAVITERFGCNQFLFNFYNKNWYSDADYFAGFYCYEDNEMGLQKFTSKPCDYRDEVGIQKNYQNFDIRLYPNPANDVLKITGENVTLDGESMVSIKDLSGREIKRFKFSLMDASEQRINISDLSEGLYLLSIFNEGEEVYKGKLVRGD